MNVKTYDAHNLDPVPASISYKCFDTSCYIGKSDITGEDAALTADFPQCVNGYIIAQAEGYQNAKTIVSTTTSGEAKLFLEKKYKLSLDVTKAGKTLKDEYAIISFIGSNNVTAVYPQQKSIELTEGDYEVKIYVYANSTITLSGSTSDKCVDVPKSGVSGVFGATDEKCFTLVIPDQVVSFAVSGGGNSAAYVSETELESGKLNLDAADFGKPTKVEDLQTNYNKILTESLDINFGGENE
jgi:hypothetical protein